MARHMRQSPPITSGWLKNPDPASDIVAVKITKYAPGASWASHSRGDWDITYKHRDNSEEINTRFETYLLWELRDSGRLSEKPQHRQTLHDTVKTFIDENKQRSPSR